MYISRSFLPFWLFLKNKLISPVFGNHMEKILFARVKWRGFEVVQSSCRPSTTSWSGSRLGFPRGDVKCSWWNEDLEAPAETQLGLQWLREVQICVHQPFKKHKTSKLSVDFIVIPNMQMDNKGKKVSMLVGISRTEKQTKSIWSHLPLLTSTRNSIISLRSSFRIPFL